MSAVSVLVIDCTTTGASPPTVTAPMRTATLLRRPSDMDMRRMTIPCACRPFPLESPGRNMVLPESPRTRGAEGATRPETLRHPNGRNRRTLESGPRGPTEGERNRGRAGTQSLRFQDRGAADLRVRRPFFIGHRGCRYSRWDDGH